MPRAEVRALLFDYLDGRLGGRHTELTAAALNTLEKLSPSLHAEIVKAHIEGRRSDVNWKREAEAIESFGQILEWHGVSRSGVRRSSVAA